MTEQNFDDRLLKILEQEVLKEQWKKKMPGIIFCDRIKRINKSSFDEGQMKLLN